MKFKVVDANNVSKIDGLKDSEKFVIAIHSGNYQKEDGKYVVTGVRYLKKGYTYSRITKLYRSGLRNYIVEDISLAKTWSSPAKAANEMRKLGRFPKWDLNCLFPKVTSIKDEIKDHYSAIYYIETDVGNLYREQEKFDNKENTEPSKDCVKNINKKYCRETDYPLNGSVKRVNTWYHDNAEYMWAKSPYILFDKISEAYTSRMKKMEDTLKRSYLDPEVANVL